MFVQPFGLGSAGGGARILRALLKDAPSEWLSVCVSPANEPPPPFGFESHIKCRPTFGRLERSRFSRFINLLNFRSERVLETELLKLSRVRSIHGIHAIAHSCWDTLASFKVAKMLGLPFTVSIHDDPEYLNQDNPFRHRLLARMACCWRQADNAFVICEEMGEELCRRWGRRYYSLVSDGVGPIAPNPKPERSGRIVVYFMGMANLCYEPNFVALQQALKKYSESNPTRKARLLLRCGSLRDQAIKVPEMVTVLPFGTEGDVQSDLDNVDILYQPLPLGESYRQLTRFSLSTKMITYLASGHPVLFHGPAQSAAGRLLGKNNAAFSCDSIDADRLCETIATIEGQRRLDVINAALKLVRQEFSLAMIRERFWTGLIRESQGGIPEPKSGEL